MIHLRRKSSEAFVATITPANGMAQGTTDGRSGESNNGSGAGNFTPLSSHHED